MGPPPANRHPLLNHLLVGLLVALLSCLAPAAAVRSAGPVDFAVHATATHQPAAALVSLQRPRPAPPAAVVVLALVLLMLVPPLVPVAVLPRPARPLRPAHATTGWARRTRAPPTSR